MQRYLTAVVAVFGVALTAAVLPAQSVPSRDPVLRRIWALGMDSTQTYPLAQALLDSIGPRLTGTPQQAAAIDWALARYAAWGIPARKEPSGTFRGWRRGHTHVDLIAPRVRTLEGTMLAWSVGTGGKDVEGEVILLPTDSADVATWLQHAKGKYLLNSAAPPTCRPGEDWKQWAAPNSRPGRPGATAAAPRRATLTAGQVEAAGVAGVLTSNWSGGWGVDKVFSSKTKQVPSIQLSCEDYGLVYRLAESRQGPRIRVNADAESLGDVPVFNAVAEIKGIDKPTEYVMLSAHFDSWDGASGATDNGTGSVVMMEAMRILKTAYPKPKRTILAGLWSGEEQGLLGSRAFVKAQPEVVDGLHVLFNQDNGTGRIVKISAKAFRAAAQYIEHWLKQVPPELARDIEREFPGDRQGGGSDHASFVAAGAPGLPISGLSWNYWTYTWHTNRDTFDKLSFDDLKANATLVAMLVYLASEDATKLPRK